MVSSPTEIVGYFEGEFNGLKGNKKEGPPAKSEPSCSSEIFKPITD